MNMEWILLGGLVFSILIESLIYSVVAYFLLFRNEETKPRFWKILKVYFLVLVAFNLLGLLVGFLLMYLNLMIVIYFFNAFPLLMLLFKIVTTLLFVGYFSGRWIKYTHGKSIGIVQSGKVVAIVLVLSIVFSFFMGTLTTKERSMKSSIEASVARQKSIAPVRNYEQVMNMPLSKEIREFKHVSGIEYGLYTDLVFHYYAPQSYFENLKSNTNFIQEIWLNSVFQEVECYNAKTDMLCYKGTIYPYVHEISYNSKTEEVKHSVTGISD